MAQKTIVELIDDIDGEPAEETVRFALDDVSYEIDLSAVNADRLRRDLAPYVAKARKAGTAKPAGRPARPVQDRERSADIRAWARQYGIPLNDRGRVPARVVEAYQAGDPSLAKTPKKVPEVKFEAGL